MWRFRLGQISDRLEDVESENTASRLVAFAPNGEERIPADRALPGRGRAQRSGAAGGIVGPGLAVVGQHSRRLSPAVLTLAFSLRGKQL